MVLAYAGAHLCAIHHNTIAQHVVNKKLTLFANNSADTVQKLILKNIAALCLSTTLKHIAEWFLSTTVFARQNIATKFAKINMLDIFLLTT